MNLHAGAPGGCVQIKLQQREKFGIEQGREGARYVQKPVEPLPELDGQGARFPWPGELHACGLFQRQTQSQFLGCQARAPSRAHNCSSTGSAETPVAQVASEIPADCFFEYSGD
jgi:hypothetical protein